ncbi:MAG: hypothetical protein QMC23_11520 [Rubritalea sp.]|jgi:hypothetical protein|tara:strand:- start:475 stop:894 length:420 start_codon:yes stop_codon:yes gene_type:complete
MSRKVQRILLGKGLDDLPFGASQGDVEAVLGKAEETDEFDMRGEKSLAWHYWNVGISVNFDEKQQYRLSSIDVAAPEVKLFGEVLIGKSREDVKNFLDQQDIGVSVDEVQRGLIYPDANLSLWFNGGDLEEIQWGVIEA